MPRNFKFHLLSVTAIIVSIVFVFYTTGQFDPPAQAPAAKVITQSPYKISIIEANWGLNCKKHLQKEIENLEKKISLSTGKQYEELQKKLNTLLPLPVRNNAKEKLSKFCIDADICELKITKESLDLKTINNCQKELEVVYRCHQADSLRTMTTRQYRSDTLDCNLTKPK